MKLIIFLIANPVMLKVTNDKIRLWVIPFLKTFVWVCSFFISLRYNFGNMDDPHTIRGLMLFCTIGLVADIALDCGEIMLSLESYHLDRDGWWTVQSSVIPYIILALTFSLIAYFREWNDVKHIDLDVNTVWIYVIGYGISLGLLKIGVSHVDVYADLHKIKNEEYQQPCAIPVACA